MEGWLETLAQTPRRGNLSGIALSFAPSKLAILLRSGPAKILAIVIDRKLGAIHRFPRAKHFNSY
jgi:hypothetical protein